MAWKNDGKRDWLCKKCTDKKGEHFCNFGWRAACKQCGLVKGKSQWKDVPAAPPRSSTANTSPQRIKQLEQELRASRAKVHELQKSGAGTEANGPQETAGEKDELATLRKDVECLQRVSGEEAAALLQAKRRRIEELTVRKRAERPAHVQLKELEERMEKKQKFIARQSSVISELEEKVCKVREEVTKAEDDIKVLQAQKDVLLRSPSQAAADGAAGGAAKALAAEISKFQETESIDIETASVAADDMDAEEQAEMDRIEKMETSVDGGKAKRAAMLSFTRGVVVKHAKRRFQKRKA